MSVWLLNTLTLAVVAVAALYVLRYAARLMGWNRWGARQQSREVATDSSGSPGSCGPGGCSNCSQREAHGKVGPGGGRAGHHQKQDD